MTRRSLVVSVVSGANHDNVLTFLPSLYETAPLDLDVSVVAVVNDGDHSLASAIDEGAASAGWSDRVTVIVNEEPKGFATNHNRVMRERAADLYLLANDDVIVLADAIAELVRHLDTDDGARTAVVSPQLLNADGSVQPSTYGFPTLGRFLMSISGVRDTKPVTWAIRTVGRTSSRFGEGRSRYWAHDRMAFVDTVRGAFVLMRGAAIAEVGPMDEVARVGGEETEWHKRFADRGWRVAFVPAASVVHLEKQTVSTDPRFQLEYLRGWLNYFDKHTPSRARLTRTLAAGAFAMRWAGNVIRFDAPRRRLAADGISIALERREPS